MVHCEILTVVLYSFQYNCAVLISGIVFTSRCDSAAELDSWFGLYSDLSCDLDLVDTFYVFIRDSDMFISVLSKTTSDSDNVPLTDF